MQLTGKETRKFEQLAQKIAPASKLLRAWELKGGVSAQVTGLEIEHPNGARKKLLVRQHGAVDLQANPQIAADEFRLLQFLKSAGIAVPTPYYFDQSGEMLGSPCIVLEFIEGTSEFTPNDLDDFLRQLAVQLAKIHAIAGANPELSFLPQQDKMVAQKLKLAERPETLDEALQEGRIRDILERLWPFSGGNSPALLPGDFWRGNLLWKDGQIAAVVDWEDARIGDALGDLANSRLEMLWAYGMEGMELFTRHYQSITTLDSTNLPCWDLYAGLRAAGKLSGWGLDEATEKRMQEQHRWFVEQAIEKQEGMGQTRETSS